MLGSGSLVVVVSVSLPWVVVASGPVVTVVGASPALVGGELVIVAPFESWADPQAEVTSKRPTSAVETLRRLPSGDIR